MSYRIEVKGGETRELVDDKAIVIGSSEKADLVIAGDRVALRHARLHVAPDKVELEVVRGEEARINGVTVTGKRIVRGGDEIELGAVLLLLTDDAPADEQKKRETERALAPIENPTAVLDRARVWWPHNEMPPLELQHVWFAIEKDQDWRSLSIVPTDDSVPAVAIAHGFGRIASMNPNARVLVVDASPHSERNEGPLIDQPGHAVVRFPGAGYDFLDASALGLNDAEVAHVWVPKLLTFLEDSGARHDRVIIALGSVVKHTQSIPIARAVDAALLAVGVQKSGLDDVRKSADLIGKERLKGSIALTFD